MIWSISWKNVWRNKKRSIIVIAAVTLGTIAGVFTAGLMNGWIGQRTENIIQTEVSHINVHNPDYLLNEEIVHTIPLVSELDNYLTTNKSVIAHSNKPFFDCP